MRHPLCIGRDAGIGTELKAQAEKLNLTTNIVWLDMQKNIGNFLAITHLQIVASHEEGFSNVILEGMMSGLPMVVTDVGGNSEAIEHEQQGLVVPAHDIVALSEAILALASQPQKLISYKENTLNKAKQFSLTACIDNYINLYNSVLLEKEQ